MVKIREISYSSVPMRPVKMKNILRPGDLVQLHSSPEYRGTIKNVYLDTVDVKWIWSDKIERVKMFRLDKLTAKEL